MTTDIKDQSRTTTKQSDGAM